MKQKLAILFIFIFHNCFAQNGQYLPGGIDLHEHGSDHFDGKWKLVFSDEFNYIGAPDNMKWIPSDWGYDVSNPPASLYKAHNISVDGAYCNIQVQKESASWNGKNFDYTSGDMSSYVDFLDPNNAQSGVRNMFERGMFEARIKMSSAYWSHNNFWVFGGDGEIDIDECRGFNQKAVPNSVWNSKVSPHAECNNPGNVPFRVNEDYHIYTAIWDKYFIYFYVDHSLRTRVAKFNYYYLNDDSKGTNDNYSFNTWTTTPGYYWTKKCFYPINEAGWIILHLFLDQEQKTDWGNFWQFKKNLKKQGAGVPSRMSVDWVRVYQRDVCEEDEVVTSSVLLPYNNLNDRTITLGTQSSTPWTNIVPYWGSATYRATAITLLPNFECTPVYQFHDGAEHTTNFLFQARPCPDSYDEYIYPSELNTESIIGPTEDNNNDIDSFDCSDLDTAYVDSLVFALMGQNDTAALNIVHQYIFDSLGCNYWPVSGNENKGHSSGSVYDHKGVRIVTSQSGYISIYPNPNNGTFTISIPEGGDYDMKVVSIVGVTVYETRLKDERKREIQLEDKLPPGNYTVHLIGKDVNYIEKLVIVK